MRGLRWLLLLGVLLALAGCTRKAEVELGCPYAADQVRACVDDDCRVLDPGQTHVWKVEWFYTLVSGSTKEVEIYFADTEYPNLYNYTEKVELSDDDSIFRARGWSKKDGKVREKILVEEPDISHR